MALVNQETGLTQQEAAVKTRPRGPGFPVASLALGALSLIGMMISIWMIFLYAPTDAIEGQPQRIFYFHVPIAWIAMLAFVVVAVAGIGYLWKKDERWDWVARAAAELGTVFATLTLILWFIYIGYLMLRSYMGRTHESARAGAVLAIIGVIDIPIIYESVNWWRTLHPQAEVGTPGALPPSVVLTLMISLATFTLFYSFLMIQLYQLQRIQALAQRLRAGME